MDLVPVVDQNNQPLMPTTSSRAKKWIRSKKATPFWKKGVFCVRLNIEPSGREKQDICVGIDPGIKREAFTVKSSSHTYLNVLTETVNWVKDAVETRRIIRRGRRFRKTRYREARFNNRIKSKLPPSVKARWQWKLNVLNWLSKMFPITHVVVEDICAKTRKGGKKWNKSFSPLEVGKNWFYNKVREKYTLFTKEGWETKGLRDELGLNKSSSKLADKFECHNVDSWILANWCTGGHVVPDNKKLLKLIPLRLHRRQLHDLQFSKKWGRRPYGGTRSLGFKRGSLVKHKKYGTRVYVGGTSKGRISLHSVDSGNRMCQNAKIEDCVFKTYLGWRIAS